MPQIKIAERRDANHGKADGHHAVKKQKAGRDRRTIFRLEVVQAGDRCMKIVVRQKAQRSRCRDTDDLFVFFVHASQSAPAARWKWFRKVPQTRRVWPADFFPRPVRYVAGYDLAASDATSATIRPTFSDARANSKCAFFSRYQALTLTTRNAPAHHAPQTV